MSIRASKAGFVLGLVLRQSNLWRRTLVTSAPAVQSVWSALDVELLTDSTPTSTPPSFSFLEVESADYRAAAISLPPRPLTQRPIPWPTLFPQAHPSTPPTKHIQPMRCDSIVRHVASGDLAAARAVYDDLRRLQIPTHARAVYLSAATACLDANPPDKDGFLFWLNLIPNRPATRSHPSLKTTWKPIVERISEILGRDFQFLSQFLMLAAKKGLLPVVLRPFMNYLVLNLSPQQSVNIMGNVTQTYIINTSPQESESARGLKHRTVAEKQVSGWWNRYMIAMASAGWTDAVTELLNNPPSSVQWSEPARQRLDQLLYHPRDAEDENTDDQALPDVPWQPRILAQRLRHALHHPPSPTTLATIIRHLEYISSSHPTILHRFKSRFCRPPGALFISLSSRQNLWRHAQLISIRASGSHETAISHFSAHWQWYGLPLSFRSIVPTSTSLKAFPSIDIITSILPSLLSCTLTSDLRSRHMQYLQLAHVLPPSWRPTSATHSTFIREICHRLGPAEGISALHAVIDEGFDPGLQSYNVLLCSLARRGKDDQMIQLLEAMRSTDFEEGSIHGLVGRLPFPNARTYDGIIYVLEKRGDIGLAGQIKRLKREDIDRYRQDEMVVEAQQL
ncbi:hypothetical protein TREMEDRAFT_72633 [Tremella mesenterica DSM 1558]|uniref:uncharacterized protein n=1 Tax=Tremella mesenterica (strain ATCC 24925 / CBS 8224 / DSM 1558 / NBRC 9311 / NRRL Y-6157 / RJB 2259-6 / UBC 559-6) TaxID=578456 RepID=UPI0003F4A13A|nr:uncharacterized protein TREMEDRAFT_72633 [Tremella mesenterica DSM 1558]EIW72023.1 hypothetical protein TREMEDRAFT_72633 [Tremella mesenterica DSM 1558]